MNKFPGISPQERTLNVSSLRPLMTSRRLEATLWSLWPVAKEGVRRAVRDVRPRARLYIKMDGSNIESLLKQDEVF